jgi:hypothetical protein
MMIAAMQMAEKKVCAQRSYRMAMRRQSLSLANIFSTLCRCLYKVLQYVAGCLRFARGGMHGVIPRSINAARQASLSYPLSPGISDAPGKSDSNVAAPLCSDCGPSVNKSRTGRPSPSQTACSFEFSPPLVRPIARGTFPLLADCTLCGAP